MFSDPVKRGQALCGELCTLCFRVQTKQRLNLHCITVPLFYGVMEAVVLGLYCIIAWKCGWTKAPKDENFCVMIAKTYEVDEEDDDPTLERLIYEESAEAAPTKSIAEVDEEA
jgi:hypothetical protein